MFIQTFVFNPFYENTYLIYDDDHVGFVVDPGCYEDYEKEELSKFIEEKKIKIDCVVNTHCHIDHVLGNAFIKEQYNVPIKIPSGEKDMLEAVKAYSTNWGINNYEAAEPDELLEEGHLKIGELTFQTILAPGHSPGHLVFYHQESGSLIGGDVLFRQSIGRTDLPGGNHEQLIASIKNKIFLLPDTTTVYSGHGAITTIGYEKDHNPFLQ